MHSISCASASVCILHLLGGEVLGCGCWNASIFLCKKSVSVSRSQRCSSNWIWTLVSILRHVAQQRDNSEVQDPSTVGHCHNKYSGMPVFVLAPEVTQSLMKLVSSRALDYVFIVLFYTEVSLDYFNCFTLHLPVNLWKGEDQDRFFNSILFIYFLCVSKDALSIVTGSIYGMAERKPPSCPKSSYFQQ